MTDPTPNEIIVEHLLRDSEKRHAYQHEFSLAGFRTLILLNGGAIISLLTYIGHNSRDLAGQFSKAFIWYVVGLVAVVLSYLAAYYSQGAFLNAAASEAFSRAGLKAQGNKTPEQHILIGRRAIAVAVGLCVLSLVAFTVGSWCAMRGLTQR